MWLVILSLEPAIILKEIAIKANKFTSVSVNKCQLNVILKEDLILNLGILFLLNGRGFAWGYLKHKDLFSYMERDGGGAFIRFQ